MKNKMLILALSGCLLLADNAKADDLIPAQGSRYVSASAAVSGGGYVALGTVFGSQETTYEYFEIDLFGVRDLNKAPATIINSGYKGVLGDTFKMFNYFGLEVAATFGTTFQFVGAKFAQDNTFGYRAGISYFAKPTLKVGAYYNYTDGQDKQQLFSPSKTYKYDDVSIGLNYYF